MKKILIFVLVLAMGTQNGFAFGDRYARTTSRGVVVDHNDSVIGEIGDWTQFAIPLSAFAYSAIIGDWNGALQLGESVGSTFAATELLKYTVNEERPGEGEDSKGHTFPSGHTSFAFAGAAYWQMRYGWYVGAPMYAAAAFVGYSRVRVKMHNWTDVGVGAALGIGANLIFTSKYMPENLDVSVAPTDGGAYLSFHTRF